MKSLLSKTLLLVGYASQQTEAGSSILGREPGLALQLTEGFFREFREVMLNDYIQILNVKRDRLLPTEIDGAMWTVKDIEYNDLAVQFDRFNVDFDEHTHEVTIDFPLLSSFVMHGTYSFD
jgi:hypothetical protein